MRVLLSMLVGAIPALFVALTGFPALADVLTPILAAAVAGGVLVSLYKLWYTPAAGQS